MIYVSTCAGRHHRVSEDTVLVGKDVLYETARVLPMPGNGFVCVADGVGGNRGGAEASHFVCSSLSEIEELSPDGIGPLLTKINTALIDKSKAEPAFSQMATTLSGIYMAEDTAWLIHVGNTRVFVRQGKYLKQLTSDHTTFNLLKSSGQNEAAGTCDKNEITNCLGGGDPALLAKLVVTELHHFSLLLLTSDGVHEYVELDTLEDILSGAGSYSDKCDEMIRAAKDAGSEDDLSVVIVCPSEK